MTDTTNTVAVEANVETRERLIALINEARHDAKQEGSIDHAVDVAITGTVIAVETAVLTGGVGSIVDLNQELGKSWAEKVNS